MSASAAVEKFNVLTLSQKIIAASGVVAVASQMMNWVDIGLMAQTGLQQGGWMMLVFFIYPVYTVVKDVPLNRILGCICGALAVLATIGYISSKDVNLMGSEVNVAAAGAYIFLLSSVAMVVGSAITKKPVEETNEQ
jgi:hypothetical protein